MWLLICAAAYLTSLVSGVFGMAGGLMLMGALGFIFSVPEAMALHGLMQASANGSRAVIQLKHIRWPTLGWYALGAAGAAGALLALTVAPSKAALYLLLGATPLLTWLPKDRITLDAARPEQAALCGFLVVGLNTASGVAGPLLDIFFIRTSMGRHTIVATKAAAQVLSHLIKIAYYGAPLLLSSPAAAGRLGQLFLLSLPLTLLGTWTGSRILERFSDEGFRRWTRRIVTGIGAAYLARGGMLLIAP
jgi:uncharacterized membrane protein YfcA